MESWKLFLFVVLGIVITICLMIPGTGITYQEAIGQTESQTESNASGDFGNGYFTEISSWSDPGYSYTIVYANDTKVKYICIDGYKTFNIMPLYNTDGTLQIYEE